MEIKDELKEMLVNNAASWGKKEGDDMAEIYVDDFLNELLSKFKLLPIHDVSKAFYCLEGGIKGSEHVCKKQCDSCNRFQQ